MKKITRTLFYASMIALVLSACSDKDPKDVDNSDKKAEFLTFGFYAEDNAELEQDYIVENITREMVIRIPEELDWTSLVARFTTSDNDVVTIDDTEQVSGVTANDFTEAIDYIVSDSDAKLSNPYTVKVRKELVMKWEHLISYAETGYLMTDSYQAKIAPDNTLYVVYTRTTTEDGSDGEKASVVKLVNDQFQLVGSTGFSAGRARMPAITINTDGVPSVFFADGANTNFATAMTYSSGSWSIMGSHSYAGKPATSGNKSAMAYDPSDKSKIITAFHLATAITGGLTKRALDLSYWDGKTWDANTTISDLSGTNIYNPVFLNKGNKLYLACTMQGATGKYYLYEYAGAKNWTKIDAFLPTDATQPNILGLDLDVDSDGNIYLIAGGDEDESSVWKPAVYKYTSSTKTWGRISTPVPYTKTLTSSFRYAMALDGNDSPVVVYLAEETSIPTMLTLDPATRAWNAPVSLGSTAATNNDITVTFDSNGVGYVAFFVKDETTGNKLQVYRYAMDTDDE